MTKASTLIMDAIYQQYLQSAAEQHILARMIEMKCEQGEGLTEEEKMNIQKRMKYLDEFMEVCMFEIKKMEDSLQKREPKEELCKPQPQNILN